MQRVLVIGSPGAGKSTFARKLAARTGLPLVHLDDEYWQPGWIRPPREDWRARVRELTTPPRWILDGNYTGTLEARAERADHVIVLTYPRALCLWRALRRAALERHAPDLAFLQFIWTFPALGREQVERLRTFPHLTVVVLRGDREARLYLNTLTAAPG